MLTLFRIGLFGAAQGWERVAKRVPIPKICHTYPTVMKLGTIIPYLTKTQKHINHVTHLLSSADISIFLLEIIKKYGYTLHFDTYFLILLTFFRSFKVVLTNMIPILMMSAKLVILNLLKVKVFWNEGYDLIICVNDVTNKILWCDSNYIVNVVMWPKFGNSSISMREVIKTSIL